MAYVVSSPGSCGELVQGYGWGSSFMITCPIDRYSCARSYLRASSGTLPEKSEQARIRTLQYLGKESAQIDICLASAIPVGKGMASSTADISAVCQATALACGSLLSPEEIAAIAISIEPSDGTFYPGIVQFDYRGGQVIKKLGTVPEARILVYDCGGKVDTLAFNVRKELIAMQKKNEAEIRRAVSLCLEGLRTGSIDCIGEAATISAFANQKILYKEALEPFYEAGMHAGGRGVIAAHSGTVLGLLLAPEDDEAEIREEMAHALGGKVTFIDSVQMTNSGMIIREM